MVDRLDDWWHDKEFIKWQISGLQAKNARVVYEVVDRIEHVAEKYVTEKRSYYDRSESPSPPPREDPAVANISLEEIEAERVKLVHTHKFSKDLGNDIKKLKETAGKLEYWDVFERRIDNLIWDCDASYRFVEFGLNDQAKQAAEMRFQKDEAQKRARRAQIAQEKRERMWKTAREQASKKRAAPDSSPTATDSGSPDRSSPAMTEAIPPPAKKAKKCLEPPRRPEATDAFYSRVTKEEHWAGTNHTAKLKLSHIGRIQETDAGEAAPYTCSHCKYEKEICRVYKESGIGKYFYARGTNNWRICGHCRFREWPCDHYEDAIKKFPTEKEVQFEEEMQVMSKFMENGAHYPGAAFIKAEVARIRREQAAAALQAEQAG